MTSLLGRVAGTLLVGYIGAPIVDRSNLLRCLDISNTSISVRLHQVIRKEAEIYHLIRLGNLAGVKALLRRKQASPFDVDFGDAWTALHHAVVWEQTSIIKLLLQAGADPLMRNNDPFPKSATHIAWESLLCPDTTPHAKTAFSELLPVHDVDHAVHGRKFTAIHKACLGLDSRITSFDALAALLRDSRPLINVADAAGRTAIHWVARKGDVKVIEALLRCGANPDVVDSDFWTPLHFAVQSGSVDAVTALVSAGADLNIKNRWGETALHLNRPKIAHNPRLAQVLMVGLRGGRVDTTDNRGQTPLHVAASLGNVRVLKIFLDHSAAIDASRSDGSSALALAIRMQMTAAAKFLLKRGAHTYGVNNHGHTLLHLVALYGSVSMMKSMRGKLEIDVYAADKDGNTAMDLLSMRLEEENGDEENAMELAKGFRLLANSARLTDEQTG